jgi:hypothetical protein
MVATYDFSYNTTGIPSHTASKETIQQAVQEAVRGAIPHVVRAQQVELHITVHIHLHSAGAPAA